MPYASLREFIDRLESSGRLVRVSTPVSPVLEMTEIQTRLLAEGGQGDASIWEALDRVRSWWGKKGRCATEEQADVDTPPAPAFKSRLPALCPSRPGSGS